MSTKPGFARNLSTTRLDLILFDLSNPTHLELNLRLLHDPAFQSNFGDYGLHTQADIHRLWSSTLIDVLLKKWVYRLKALGTDKFIHLRSRQ